MNVNEARITMCYRFIGLANDSVYNLSLYLGVAGGRLGL